MDTFVFNLMLSLIALLPFTLLSEENSIENINDYLVFYLH